MANNILSDIPGNTSGRKIDVMGIVNLTDNSYFAESRCLGENGKPLIDKILSRIKRMTEDGADIIDIGACSTRPGSEPVRESEEWTRIEPVISEVKKAFPNLCISIDTYWASVVEKTFDTIGNFIVNDISAGEDDSKMLPTVGRLGLNYIAMHKRGTPKTMQAMTEYDNVTDDIIGYFKNFAIRADEAGIKDWILDPGFGFAKTIDQNYELLDRLEKFKGFGKRILVGVSRKSMIYRLFGITPEESLPATQVLHYAALSRGADILRVHDVKEAVQTLQLYNRLNGR